MKPHIYRGFGFDRAKVFGWMWCCRSFGNGRAIAGAGHTIAEAYEVWKYWQ